MQATDKGQAVVDMDTLLQLLDMNNQADMLLATREDLQKSRFRSRTKDISVNAINQVYAQAALNYGLQPRDAYEMLTREMDGVQRFSTGVEE